MPRYSKLIKCSYCGKNFKSKKERNRVKYICSKYDTKNECVRIPISEKFLDELIEMRFRRELTDDEVWKEISHIEVSREKIIINYKRQPDPTVISNNYAQF